MYTINASDSQDFNDASVNVASCQASGSKMREDRVNITQAMRPPQTTNAREDKADTLFLLVLSETTVSFDLCCAVFKADCTDACFEAILPKLQPIAAIKI